MPIPPGSELKLLNCMTYLMTYLMYIEKEAQDILIFCIKLPASLGDKGLFNCFITYEVIH